MIRITSESSLVVSDRRSTWAATNSSYRATAGAKYDSARKAQVTVITASRDCRELKAAGFQLDIAPDVRASSGAIVAQVSMTLGLPSHGRKRRTRSYSTRSSALSVPEDRDGMAVVASRCAYDNEMGLGRLSKRLWPCRTSRPCSWYVRQSQGVWKRGTPLHPEYKVTSLWTRFVSLASRGRNPRH